MVRRYHRTKTADIRAALADTRRHPRSVLQNSLGLLVALLTRGKRRHGRRGWHVYHQATGLGAWLPRFSGQTAITIGWVTFVDRERLRAGGSLWWHEYRHYQQSTRRGLAFLPAYLAEQASHGYGANRFEQDAYAYGARLAGRGPLNA